MAMKNSYISINGDRIFVKGAKKSALYDTKDYKIYSLSESRSQILSLSQKQVQIADLIVKHKDVTGQIIEAVVEHPF